MAGGIAGRRVVGMVTDARAQAEALVERSMKHEQQDRNRSSE
ncbi:hypothetical protein QMK19_29335 [Streptomyces sp. H10-C2]|nr:MULTISPECIES: hypothetical protein [unclassified Streptomyces]MDJ0344285.1 hypothetical protein [Streptomyces sp. PH10-H1]MDJ0373654.1 hypothetical protein [Streptomyces sp. H10-C2]